MREKQYKEENKQSKANEDRVKEKIVANRNTNY